MKKRRKRGKRKRWEKKNRKTERGIMRKRKKTEEREIDNVK